MTSIQHSLLPDSELHGIRGATAAVSGTVPIADGIGDYSWSSFSDSIGFVSMVNNSTATTNGGVGVWGKIAGTTVLSSNSKRFTMTATNELRYDGSDTIDVSILVSLTAARSSGTGGEDTEYTIYKDSGSGFTILDSNVISYVEIDSKARGVTIIARDIANTNDKYSVYARNNTGGTTQILVPSMQFDIQGKVVYT